MTVTATVKPSCRFVLDSPADASMPAARVTCGRADLRTLRVSTDDAARPVGLPATSVRQAAAFAEVRFVLPAVDALVASARLASLPPASTPRPVTVTFEF